MIPKELLDKYKVLQLLHHGIGGDIWIVEHIDLAGRRVVKTIEKSHPQYDVLVAEAKVLQQCRHPSIPIIYDILNFDTKTYIVEEFIEGENLKQYILRQRSLSASLLLNFSMQLCEILQFLHNPVRAILYLDLKPENILISNHQIKLVDFGSAICRNQKNRKRFIFGTPGYCAPEVKQSEELTEQADIYCLGKCMEFMLFYTPKVPRGYQNIVDRCLRKSGEEYSSVEEILKNLKKIGSRKAKRKSGETWYAVASVLSEHESSMTSLQIAAYLRDRYKKPVLYLDCTKDFQMDWLEQTVQERERKCFVFERDGITVAKRVAPQEVGGWRGRGYRYIVCSFGENSPLLSDCPFARCIFAGALNEITIKSWENAVLPVYERYKIVLALTGGDFAFAKQRFGERCKIRKLAAYFTVFGTSKRFGRQVRSLLK